MPRRSVADAALTHEAILGRAVDMASTDGLEGLTIGRLAADLEMSKAGVIGHFGSKEALQLAALEQAIEVFSAEVWEPAARRPAGRARLEAIADGWISYLRRDVFPGGCFLTAASCEWDGRGGPVREAVAAAFVRWRRVIEHETRTAIALGELAPGTDPAQVAFELNAIAMGLNQALQLHRDRKALSRAKAAMARAIAR
ncbi:MAG: hypothetical protein QOF57_1088 [Frankiaceae bacterium]|nr:hypothetical protein [Frankiaceae bacterium]